MHMGPRPRRTQGHLALTPTPQLKQRRAKGQTRAEGQRRAKGQTRAEGQMRAKGQMRAEGRHAQIPVIGTGGMPDNFKMKIPPQDLCIWAARKSRFRRSKPES